MADRYARQRMIPGWDQDRLSKATAVVVGVGALGNEVAKNLALAGIGRVVLCDFDTVSTSNLSRTVLFSSEDVGRPKVEAAVAALRSLTPDVVVDPRPVDLVAGVGLGELADADIMLGCLDSRRARLQLLGRCALVEAPLVDGGTHPWGGEMRLRLSVEEPCYGCSLTPAQRGESDLPQSCHDDRPQPQASSIASTAVVAGWMALTALRIVFDAPPAARFIQVDGLTAHTGAVTVTRDESCPHHRPLGPPEHTTLTNRSTVAELLSALPSGAVPLTWAGFPVRSDGSGRAWSSQELTAAEPHQPLAALGVAPEEILPVRLPQGEYQWLRLSKG